MKKISKTQIDLLGNRLRKTSLSEADLEMLDDYRKSFGTAYENVVRAIREQLKLEPTGRPAKSTTSIIEKLHRESVRLSQVQDIAGCRVVVDDIKKQNNAIKRLSKIFPMATIVDRRIHPSYGYRAVHVVIKNLEKLIEVQIRTELQHGWSEFSEKLADKFDASIKYGGGDKKIQKLLVDISELIKGYEEAEIKILGLPKNKRDKQLKKEMLNQKKLIAGHIKEHLRLFL